MKTTKSMRTINDLDGADIRSIYDGFDSSIATLDCGRKCAPHNPGGKPFCCDICHAVPAAYKSEWRYLQPATDLWHAYRGDECEADANARGKLKAGMPRNMILLACLGPHQCQRDFRALSCRQFPFFPYVTSDYRFIGLAYEWEFEDRCWVVSNLPLVTQKYRQEFVRTYDHLFALFQNEFENYAYHSERLRGYYAGKKRRFALLHRNGAAYLVGPRNERMARVNVEDLPKFGFYRT